MQATFGSEGRGGQGERGLAKAEPASQTSIWEKMQAQGTCHGMALSSRPPCPDPLESLGPAAPGPLPCTGRPAGSQHEVVQAARAAQVTAGQRRIVSSEGQAGRRAGGQAHRCRYQTAQTHPPLPLPPRAELPLGQRAQQPPAPPSGACGAARCRCCWVLRRGWRGCWVQHPSCQMAGSCRGTARCARSCCGRRDRKGSPGRAGMLLPPPLTLTPLALLPLPLLRLRSEIRCCRLPQSHAAACCRAQSRRCCRSAAKARAATRPPAARAPAAAASAAWWVPLARLPTGALGHASESLRWST